MKKTLIISVLIGLFASSVFAKETPANKLSKEERQAGWRSLFNGKDMSAWRNFKQEEVSEGWQVVDGEIRRVGKNAGDIVTKKKFMAFELSLDYKISKGGNSGLMYHVTETEQTPWMSGPEIQIQDNKDGHDPQKAGWLYQLYPAEIDATNPAGEWNTLRILITPEKCEHYMNGKKYCEYVKGSDDWNKKVEASKFGKMANFGKSKNGFISLQDHGNEVAFRNIKVRRIPVEGKVQRNKKSKKKEAATAAE